ncbi:MAG: hypothetical protein L3K26_03215 [Candidatus Hydrogenedentes bacterium]|nr:hypothetical protein [Candidatus Hydrogenedentota bacterium]
MKRQPTIKAIKKRRQGKLSKLGECGPFVAGSLNRVEKKNKLGETTAYYLLTFKEEGKTRSVYVPKDLVEEVRGWIRNHQKLKKAIAQVSADSIAAIRRHVPEKRAESARSPINKKTP